MIELTTGSANTRRRAPDSIELTFKNYVLRMVRAAALGNTLRPNISLADTRTPIDLKAIVPKAVGDGHQEPNTMSQVIDPQCKDPLGQKVESTTYWTMVRDHITRSGIDKKKTEMRYALAGETPDSMLVRVASVNTDSRNAYAVQSPFSASMVEAMAAEHRNRFAGTR